MNLGTKLLIIGGILQTIGLIGLLSEKDCSSTEIYTSNGMFNALERKIVIERHPNCKTTRASYFEDGKKVFFTTNNSDAMFKDN